MARAERSSNRPGDSRLRGSLLRIHVLAGPSKHRNQRLHHHGLRVNWNKHCVGSPAARPVVDYGCPETATCLFNEWGCGCTAASELPGVV